MLRFGPVRSLALLSLALPLSLHAAKTQATPRIGMVNVTETAPLNQNVPYAARRATDLGDESADKNLTDMTLRFSMTVAQQSALDQLLVDQQNPNSPQYRKWLTPEQFAAQFGLAASDLVKVQTWLQDQGFTVAQVARGGTFVRFSGTVVQANRAFQTSIRRLTVAGEAHFGNLAAPSLPAAIAAVTAGITGLHDFHPKSHNHREHLVAPEDAGLGVRPSFTSATSGNHFIAPGDFFTIYNENGLFASGIDGTGMTIAVAGQTDISLTDVAAFRSASGLSANLPVVRLFGNDPGTRTDDLAEAQLDVEWSGATAPNATILYVNATDVIDGSLTQAIDNNLAPIISLSYGLCESGVGGTQLTYYNNLFKMANSQGQTIFAASGDSGATDCDYQVATAKQGLAVDFPAALPTVTGVGGTMFAEGSGTYWSATNGSNSGSALSYIPEAVWNEDSSAGLASGGGGASIFFSKPTWQVGTGVPADNARDVPDVSLNSAAGHDGYLFCSSGFCTNGYRNSGGFLDVVGGTSVATPAFAGIMALLEQKIGARVGNANPGIYALANSTYYGNVFHDVTSGTNASPCTVGTTGCASGGPIGYTATTGYDRASGWGSVDAFNFVTAWPLVNPVIVTTGTVASVTTLSASATAVTAGTTVTLTAKVASGATGTTATPTGSVQFLLDGVAVGFVALSNGVATYNLSTTGLSGGAHTAQASYLGDSTFAPSSATVTLNVTAVPVPDFTLTPSSATVTVGSGKAASGLAFTVTSVNGFTGNVTFTSTTTSRTLSAQYQFSVNPVVITSAATTGTTVLTLDAYVSNATTTGLVPVAAVRQSDTAPWYAAGSGVALAGLVMFALPKRRRLAGLLAVFVSMAAVIASGCGSGGAVASSSSGTITTATTPGTYTINVAATGTINGIQVTRNAAVTFVVQ